MTPKRIVPRERARQDIAAALEHCRREAGEAVALGLIDAVQSAFRALARRPAAGSPRYGATLDIVGLRGRPLDRHPDLGFDVERADGIDILRRIHMRRDLGTALARAT